MRSRRRDSDLRLGSPGAPRSGRSRGRYPAGTLTQPGSLRTRPARRRATRALPALFTLAILGAALVAVGWWFTNLPVSAVVAATPGDAHITSLETSATGTLALDEIAPGAHTITVERAGFEPLETTIEVRRFGENSFRFDLIPLPQRLAISVEHSSAVCRVIDGDGAEVASAEGALETTLPAGAYTIEVSAPGCNTRVTELFLDRPVDMRVWPDPEGQLVECVGHIACAGAPKGVHVTPDGREAWATILNGPPSIEIFDLATMQRSGTVELGAHGAVEIIFTRDGS
ncbi:MAG: hypothetical protein U1E29_08515, partial [Coriobacteriia bacterium]|nr:hypothetical protein [Coriobacteriia bacterium]